MVAVPQARTHQLLIHNKELLDHIQTLVVQMQELESKVPVVSAVPPPSSIPQVRVTFVSFSLSALLAAGVVRARAKR